MASSTSSTRKIHIIKPSLSRADAVEMWYAMKVGLQEPCHLGLYLHLLLQHFLLMDYPLLEEVTQSVLHFASSRRSSRFASTSLVREQSKKAL